MKKGRPPKENKFAPNNGGGEGTGKEVPSFSVGLTEKCTANNKNTKVPSRGTYKSWDQGLHKDAIDAAVKAILLGEDGLAAARKIIPCIDIPRTTLGRKVKQASALLETKMTGCTKDGNASMGAK